MRKQIIKKIKRCRVCKSTKLINVLQFGMTPLANAFLKKEQLDLPEVFYPLEVYFCENCTFLQLGHVVSPELLFKNYVYVSSTSPVFVNHFKEFATQVIKRFDLNKKSLVVDIGSNDGILLKPFKEQGVRVLGIEPAAHIAEMAKRDGIETEAKFFSINLAKQIVRRRGKAKIVTGTNVFAHIDDLDEVIKGVNEILTDDGVFITESPYLVDFLKKRYFDLVYHEHLSYWAIEPLIKLFNRFGMAVVDAQKVPVHGGSIRVFAVKGRRLKETNAKVKVFQDLEQEMQLSDINTYLKYASKILENKKRLISLLTNLKLKGNRIVAYGAPAKSNTLLNYFKIGREFIDYIVDDSPLKQGLFTPGTHIPVLPPTRLKRDNPQYLFILAWNFADSIIKKHAWFKDKGGKFIIPVPSPKII